eukprot:306172-Rhodomonas_salina.1
MGVCKLCNNLKNLRTRSLSGSQSLSVTVVLAWGPAGGVGGTGREQLDHQRADLEIIMMMVIYSSSRTRLRDLPFFATQSAHAASHGTSASTAKHMIPPTSGLGCDHECGFT